MITFGIKVKENKIKGDLAKFRRYLDTLTGDLLKQEACLTARMALKLTPPMVGSGGKGDTAAAGKMGERAIDKDVGSIFAAPHATLGGVFSQKAGARARFARWRSLANPKLTTTLMQDFFTDPSEDNAFRKAENLFKNKEPRNVKVNNVGQASGLHRAQRRKGRVTKFKGPSDNVKKYPHLMKESLIKKYVGLRARAVGKLKSGWWDIINRYGRNLVIFGRTVDAGAKGLPKYITRHRFNNGSLLITNGNSKRAIIRNAMGDAEGAAQERGTHAAVISARLKALARRPYQKYANRIVRNWNNKQSPNA